MACPIEGHVLIQQPNYSIEGHVLIHHLNCNMVCPIEGHVVIQQLNYNIEGHVLIHHLNCNIGSPFYTNQGPAPTCPNPNIFSIIHNPRCVFVGNVSHSKEKGGIAIYYLFLFLMLTIFSKATLKFLLHQVNFRKRLWAMTPTGHSKCMGSPLVLTTLQTQPFLGSQGKGRTPLRTPFHMQ